MSAALGCPQASFSVRSASHMLCFGQFTRQFTARSPDESRLLNFTACITKSNVPYPERARKK
eukprot:scaffold224167_cov17-Prasinocladus_malaysianus.AAC.1